MPHSTLNHIRKKIALLNIDALIIPTSDPHNSEYIPEFYKTRAWLTGFTGSAGTAVITNEHAGLWTDSRYFIQAEAELIEPFKLHKLITREPEYIHWIIDNLSHQSNIGIDFQLFPQITIEYLLSKLKNTNITLIDTGDIYGDTWTERTPLPSGQVFEHDLLYAGQAREHKIASILNAANNIGGDGIFISTLDDIAWTLNLRGHEIDFNPVFYAYFLITKNQSILFIDASKLNENIINKLKIANITLADYQSIETYFNTNIQQTKIVVDKGNLNSRLFQQIKQSANIIESNGIVSALKAIKNNVEIDNYKLAQKRDGCAMVNFLNWIENRLTDTTLTELDLAKKSEQFRAIQPNYKGLSFTSISAYGSNAALPHYSVSEKSNKTIEKKGMYLIDSGAQYLDGTTDITRTIAVGETSNEERMDFTLVLKGHIQVALAVFPKGTKGYQIDTLARSAMWKHGRDFGHGTGHGIGYFLNVHEGPQGFSTASNGSAATVIEANMLITNEPGIYIEGSHGIRTENVLRCIEDIDNPGFLKFETLTLCPIDKKLINKALLSPEELDWINQYHQKVYTQLAPNLCQSVKTWLAEQTSAL